MGKTRRASAPSTDSAEGHRWHLFQWHSQENTWWIESEHVLLLKLQQEVFQDGAEEPTMVSKIIKPSKNLGGALKQQLLVVNKTSLTASGADLVVHTVDLGTWTVRKSISLARLNAIDGAPSKLIMDKSDGVDQNCILQLGFENGPTLIFAVMSFTEKCVVAFTLIQLCERVFGFVPTISNVPFSEMKLIATGEKYTQRCTLLTNSSHHHSRRLSDLSSEFDAHTDGDTDTDSVFKRSRENSTADDFNLKLSPRRTQSKSEKDEDERDDGGLDSKTGTELLNEDEQHELWQILQSEGLSHMPAGELADELVKRISKLEEDTGEALRSWENREEESNPGEADLADPIALLIDELDVVYNQLNEMDEWMANYNIELRTMRKDIHKIEHENNQLQVRATNHKALRQHLAKLLSRYALSKDAMRVLTEFDSEESGDVASYISRLANAAIELKNARNGKSHLKGKRADVLGPEELEAFPEEPYLLAIKRRVEELDESIAYFIQQVKKYLESKFLEAAKELTATIVSRIKSEDQILPMIINDPDEVFQHHVSLRPLRDLIYAVSDLDSTQGGRSISQLYIVKFAEAYGDIFITFFQSLYRGTTLAEDTQSQAFRLATTVPVLNGNEENDLKLAKTLAMAITRPSHLSPSIALAHALNQICPVVMHEQDFLDMVLLPDSTIETDQVLSALFQSKAQLSNALISLLDDASRDLSQVLMMIIGIESKVAAFGPRSKFLGTMLSSQQNSLDFQLRLSFERFIDEQIQWIENYRLSSKVTPMLLPPAAKVTRLLDNILALWNAAIPDEEYDFNSSTFAASLVGVGLERLLRSLLNWIESIAAGSSNPTMKELWRAENYSFLAKLWTIQRIGRALEQYSELVVSRAKDAFDNIIQSLLEDPFSEMLSFVSEVEDLLDKGCLLADVMFHKPRTHLAPLMQKLDELYIKQKFAGLCTTMRKQVHPDSPLLEALLTSLKDTICKKYARYVELLESCYGDLVNPTVEQVEQMTGALCSNTRVQF